MNVIEIEVGKIKPYEKNPRKNERAVNGVAESIKQFGFQQPIVVDKNNVIVVGHTRYKAAKKLGLKSVPCVRADDLTSEQVKAYRIADNKLNELATWDFELLGGELESFDFDFTPFDFELPQLEVGVGLPEQQAPVSKAGTFDTEASGDSVQITPDNPFATPTGEEEENASNIEYIDAEPGGVRQQVVLLKYKDVAIPMTEIEQAHFENALATYKEEFGTYFGFVGRMVCYEVQ